MFYFCSKLEISVGVWWRSENRSKKTILQLLTVSPISWVGLVMGEKRRIYPSPLSVPTQTGLDRLRNGFYLYPHNWLEVVTSLLHLYSSIIRTSVYREVAISPIYRRLQYPITGRLQYQQFTGRLQYQQFTERLQYQQFKGRLQYQQFAGRLKYQFTGRLQYQQFTGRLQ